MGRCGERDEAMHGGMRRSSRRHPPRCPSHLPLSPYRPCRATIVRSRRRRTEAPHIEHERQYERGAEGGRVSIRQGAGGGT